jgi:EAL domain-containing protein (putative c-di-GMP-specific phosphodiesterase class I)
VVALNEHPTGRRRRLIDDLQNALERHEFVLHYQPFIDAVTNRVRGAEALIRWNNPDLGLLSPAVFIPLAEEAGVIVGIGSWVMQEAARFSKMLADQGEELMIAFNVAAPQFRDRAFLDRLDRALEFTNGDARRLILEVTESVAIDDSENARRVLGECRRRRLKIALDDFGTGYSSLAHLRELPADTVKIDKSFVATLPDQSESALICSAIIELAHRLGITVHAEGVETEAQLEWLKSEGCDFAQGYLIGMPMPEVEFLAWLDSVRNGGAVRSAAAQ